MIWLSPSFAKLLSYRLFVWDNSQPFPFLTSSKDYLEGKCFTMGLPSPSCPSISGWEGLNLFFLLFFLLLLGVSLAIFNWFSYVFFLFVSVVILCYSFIYLFFLLFLILFLGFFFSLFILICDLVVFIIIIVIIIIVYYISYNNYYYYYLYHYYY